MILDEWRFVPILVSVVIVLSTFFIKKKRTIKIVLIVNFIVLAIFYACMFYVDHQNYINTAWYEVENEILTEFFLDIAYKLYYHIFAILLFLGANLLVLFKRFQPISHEK